MSVVLGLVLLSTLVALAFLIRPRPTNSVRPNTALPEIVQRLLPAANEKAFVSLPPWLPQVDRTSLRCRTQQCGSAAFVTILGPTRGNAWHLQTQKDMRTGWPLEYPVSTVLEVPKNASYKFILDAGLVPLVQQDGSVLNMGPFWWDPDAPSEGRNLTGDFVHSFAIHNSSASTVYFGRASIGVNNPADYWTLLPGSWTLFWPETTYFGHIDQPTYWNAADITSDSMSPELASWAAETLMYSYLRPKMPVP